MCESVQLRAREPCSTWSSTCSGASATPFPDTVCRRRCVGRVLCVKHVAHSPAAMIRWSTAIQFPQSYAMAFAGLQASSS